MYFKQPEKVQIYKGNLVSTCFLTPAILKMLIFGNRQLQYSAATAAKKACILSLSVFINFFKLLKDTPKTN